jgi:PAS domain S-box-containing protein
MSTPNGQILSARSIGRRQEDHMRARLASIVHSSADAIIGETLDGIITDWNPAAERLYGFSAAEIIGQHRSLLLPPAEIGAVDEMAARVQRGEHIEDLETVRWTKDGRRIEVALTVSPVWDEAGALVGASIIVRDITARKATERALAASEMLFRVAFANAPIGMVLASPDETPIRVNHALCQMLGYSESELLSTGLWAVTHPDDVEANRAAMRSALAGEIDAYALEKRYLHRDGHIVWGHLNGSLVRDDSGAPLYFVSQIQDITARKAAEAEFAQLTEELQASEARFRTLVEQLPAAVYLLANKDQNETPLYFSPSIEAVTGETPEEAMSSHQHWLDLVHPEDRVRVAAEDERAGARVDAFRAEYRHQRKDGSYVWVQDEYVPVKDETGRAVAWLGMLSDITERMAAEEAQARLAAVVESAEDAITSSTLDGQITSWNRGAERLFGYRAAETLGQPYTILLPEDLDDPTPAVRHAALSGEPVAPFETTRRRRDGTTFAASIALSPIRERGGRITGVSSVTRDITARKQLELELRAALEAAQSSARTKTLFLAMMSHELRTPLQAVLGYADFLFNGPPGSLTPEQREDIGYIRQGAGRMVTLIEQLLDLSRMEAGRLELASAPVALQTILEQVRQDIVPLVTAKGLAFSIAMPADLPSVLGDAVRLRQILLNLVGNAVKFTEAGSVDVTASHRGDGVAVTVRDTGIGISEEALPFIFEEFRQVDASLTRRHGGAGLGLAIARKLAEQMGGRITVASALGAGSTFTLWLPIAPRH